MFAGLPSHPGGQRSDIGVLCGIPEAEKATLKLPGTLGG